MMSPAKRKRIIITCIVLATIAMISFVEKKRSDMVCKNINIHVDNQLGNYFIDENDVMSILTNDNDDMLIGVPFEKIDLKHLEERLERHAYVYRAEVHKDLKGNLNTEVFQSRPVARLTYSGNNDKYINHLGEVIPISQKYTSRVLLINGYISAHLEEESVMENEFGQQLMEMINHINKDKFWKAMVAQLEIDKKGNIRIYTQVSKQIVEFGPPEDLDDKFKKLKIFYKDILPTKGWNTYERVSVKFKNQIVCE